MDAQEQKLEKNRRDEGVERVEIAEPQEQEEAACARAGRRLASEKR